MIAALGGALLGALARRRRATWDATWRRPTDVQEATLRSLVDRARGTELGAQHGFDSIRSVADYQARVPLREYLDFRPMWQRVLLGETNVTWPGRPRHWVKTSGTTAGDKLIPVTPEAFRSHRQGGWDALFLAAERAGGTRLLGGSLLFLGGSTALAPVGVDALVGDLSGLAVRRLPPGLRSRYAPDAETGAIDDWERRIAAMAARVSRQDVRLLAGMPSWMLVLFEHVARARREEGHPLRDLAECWPNLGVFIHGGVSFAPYRCLFDEWIGRPLSCVEVYPASEGFVALQTEPGGALTLMIDYGIFYEFVSVEDLGHDRPRRHTVGEVELGRAYAVALTTPAGLWSYLLGDTVRFVGRDPLRLLIIGRVRHFVNAFGEAPRLVELPSGTFHRWMRGAGKLGDQHKVPRATNDRRLAEALLEHAGAAEERPDSPSQPTPRPAPAASARAPASHPHPTAPRA